MIDGKRHNISKKTCTDMYTRLSAEGLKTGQYGADIYDAEGSERIVLIATSPTSDSGLRSFITDISAEEYQIISDLYDPYDGIPYHLAIMEKLGFN